MLISDPDLRIAARLDIGWSLLWSGRNADALETLIAVAAEASPRSPTLAWDATGLAATVAYQTGLPEACAKARAALDALDALGEPAPPAKDRPAVLMSTGSGSRISSPCSSGTSAVRPAAHDRPPGPTSRG